MRRSMLIVVVLALGAFAAGCAGAWYVEPGVTAVFVSAPPPPPRREVRFAAPGPHYIWVDGHWAWRGNAYVWVPGSWWARRPGYTKYSPGRWKHERRGWYWVGGRWR
ncbi:MAG: YXWGXW repeat-containing protein [Gemmatimonadaceae bacterium]